MVQLLPQEQPLAQAFQVLVLPTEVVAVPMARQQVVVYTAAVAAAAGPLWVVKG